MLTGQHLFSFKKKKLRRKMPIESIKAIILSEKKPQEFVLHIPSEYDYRYSMEGPEDFLNLLKMRYSNLDPVKTLKVYSVPDKLKHYITTEGDIKKGVTKVPPSMYRKRD